MSTPALDLGVLPGYLAGALTPGAELVVAGGKVTGLEDVGLLDFEHAMIARAAGGLLDGKVRVPTVEERETAVATASGDNPFSVVGFSVTKQYDMIRTDPRRARRLRDAAEAAGVLDPRALRVPV